MCPVSLVDNTRSALCIPHISSRSSIAGYANSVRGATHVFGSDGKAYPLANDQVKKLVNAKYVNYPVLKYIFLVV